MKKVTAILMVLTLLSSLFTIPAYAAEDEGTVSFYNFKYKNNTLYIKTGDSYYSLPLSREQGGTPYFEKTDKLGDGNVIWRVDLTELAGAKNRNSIEIYEYVSFLASDSFIYMPVTLYNKDENDFYNDWLYYILKINKATGNYEIIEPSEAGSTPYIIKKYKNKLYVYMQEEPLYYIGDNNELVSTGLPTYISTYSQSSSKSNYVYGLDYSRNGSEQLSICNLDSMKKVNTIKSIQGYAVTDDKLYYGKIINSSFKVYAASPYGKNAKVIFSKKSVKDYRYRLSRVTSKYIYYKVYRDDMFFPIYYKYSIKTKKSKTIGYEEYTTNASDYGDGFFDPVG